MTILASRVLCRALLFALAVLALSEMAPVALAQDDSQRFFRVPANTIIRVRTVENVSSETARVGDVVPMEVLSDVVVNGFVIAKQGAPAMGEISRVKEARSMGRRGHVALTLDYVEAVTGEHILVGGNRAEKGNGKAAKLTAEIALTTAATGGLIGALWLFEKGNDTSIPPGTAFSVYTAGDTLLDLALLSPHKAALSGGAPEVLRYPLPSAMSNAPMAFPALGLVVRTKVGLGAEVVGIAAGSPAEKIGLKRGYVIGSLDGNQVKSVRDFADLMAKKTPGSSVRLAWFFQSNLGWMPSPEATIVLPSD